MRLFAFKVFIQYRTPLTGHVLRTEPMLVYAQNREIAARIATEFAQDLKSMETELPFVNLKDIRDLGPAGEGMS